MKLTLVRHGETEENKKRIFQGHAPGKLTELGISQAKKLALRFKDEKIDVIYSSDLARAADTAKEIAKYHKDTPLYFAQELREKNLGKLQGRSWDEFEDLGKLINSEENEFGMEKRSDVEKRVKSLIDKVYKEYKDKDVLFVAHNGTNKIIMRILLKEAGLSDEGLDYQDNTSVNIFELKEDKKHKFLLFNCTEHLK